MEYLLVMPLKRHLSNRQKSKKLVMKVHSEKSTFLKVHHAILEELNSFFGITRSSNSPPVRERSSTSSFPEREATQLLCSSSLFGL
jgi:hypothetical protein